MQSLLAAAEAHRDWIERLIEDLVRLESPSTDKPALDRCGRELADRLETLGARVTKYPQQSAGDHVRAEFGDGGSQVLVLGHFDTVWPVGELARMPCERRDGRMTGPGVFDMKAGIAIAMLAARLLTERSARLPCRIVMLWTTDEEIGSGTSRAAIEAEARTSRAVLVLEPALPGGALKTARKGCGEFHLTVEGVTAHAGLDPGKGASAIHELADQIGIGAFGFALMRFKIGENVLDPVDGEQHERDGVAGDRHAVAEFPHQRLGGMRQGFEPRQVQESAGAFDRVDETEDVIEDVLVVWVLLETHELNVDDVEALVRLSHKVAQ